MAGRRSARDPGGAGHCGHVARKPTWLYVVAPADPRCVGCRRRAHRRAVGPNVEKKVHRAATRRLCRPTDRVGPRRRSGSAGECRRPRPRAPPSDVAGWSPPRAPTGLGCRLRQRRLDRRPGRPRRRRARRRRVRHPRATMPAPRSSRPVRLRRRPRRFAALTPTRPISAHRGLPWTCCRGAARLGGRHAGALRGWGGIGRGGAVALLRLETWRWGCYRPRPRVDPPRSPCRSPGLAGPRRRGRGSPARRPHHAARTGAMHHASDPRPDVRRQTPAARTSQVARSSDAATERPGQVRGARSVHHRPPARVSRRRRPRALMDVRAGLPRADPLAVAAEPGEQEHSGCRRR